MGRVSLWLVFASLVAVLPGAGAPDPAGAAVTEVSATGIGYGLLALDDWRGLAAGQDLGFNWIKLSLSWAGAQPTEAPVYHWYFDGLVDAARARGVQVLMRVYETPSWAREPRCREPDQFDYPPRSNAEIAELVHQAARHWRGKVAAYEIYNEPNLADEWGGCNPDPVRYTSMLGAIYPRLKQADSDALLVTSGLSNTGDGSVPGVCEGRVPVCGDLLYLQQMYTLGGGRMGTHWDALGAHPYGGPNPPEADPASHPPTGLYFRRMEDMRNIINDFGGREPVPIWATEMGWLTDFDRGCSLALGSGSSPPRHVHLASLSYRVSLEQQGDYLVRAFRYAEEHMPWAGPMFIFNLDWNVGFQPNCDPGNMFRWYSILDESGSGTSAYQKLKSMPKAWDRTPPTSSVRPFSSQVSPSASFQVTWSGSDAGSRVVSYDVQVRDGTGAWADWLVATTATSAAFPGVDRHAYSFRSRARDAAANVEVYPGTADAGTLVSTSPYLQAGTAEVVRLLARGTSSPAALRLTNLGGTTANWSATSSDPSVAVAQPASGALAPGAQTEVQLTLLAPPGGTGSVQLTASITFAGPGLWQNPLSVTARVVAADSLRRTFLPVAPKGYTGGW